MKKTIIHAAVLLLALSGARIEAEEANPNVRGELTAGAQKFKLVHYEPTWKHTSTWRGGVFHVHGGNFHVQVNRQKDGELSYLLESKEPIVTKYLALQTVIPIEEKVLVDRAEIGFGPVLDRKHWMKVFKKVSTLEIPQKNGTVVIRGRFRADLVDERLFGGSTLGIRLALQPEEGKLTRAEWKGNIAFQPIRSEKLDLRKAATFGFADRIAGDGKGGWTDQGPMNDLSILPVGRSLNVKGLEFDIINPAENGGRGCIALKCPKVPNLPARAEAVFRDRPPRGKYLYVLHALAWPAKKGRVVGEIACGMMSGPAVEKQTLVFPVVSGEHVADFWMPRELPKGTVGWKGGNASASVGLYLTRFELTGEAMDRLSFTTRDVCNWMIVGAVLSDTRIDPIRVHPVKIQAGGEWIPIHNKPDVKPGSALDFSRIVLDPPAGKYGWNTVRNGRFELEKKPGVPFRFYGTNIVYWTHYLSKKEADRFADQLAASGYNILRFHMFDFPQMIEKDLSIKPAELDKLDYLVAACKKRGIYITMDLFGTRRIRPGELSWHKKGAITHKEFKALMLIDEESMRNYETYVRKLMTHRNPYTGLAWKDDPVFATISLANEGTIFTSCNQSPLTKQVYQEAFRKYLAERKSQESAGNRDLQWKEFLLETYSKAWNRFSTLLKKELGVRCPLTDQNYWSSVPVTMLRNQLDFADNHFYWAHPVFPSGVNRYPAISMNESAISRGCGGAFGGIFATRIFGRPFTVTEWDFVNPNNYNVEGAFLTGAYASLQDWDGLCRFNYTSGKKELLEEESPIWYFQTKNDPLRMLSERAGVLFFLRKDVRPATVSYPFLLTGEDLAFEEFPGIFQILGLIGKVGTVIDLPSLPPDTRTTLGFRPSKAKLPHLVPSTPGEDLMKLKRIGQKSSGLDKTGQDHLVSSTGELVLNARDTTFQAVTPNSEGFVLSPGTTLRGAFASVVKPDTFCAVLTGAIDNEPLTRSQRILILHLTDTKNSGMAFTGPDMNTCTDPGTLPLLMRKGSAKLILNRTFDGYRLHALDFDGSEIAEIPMKTEHGKTVIELNNVQNGKGVCAYELSVKK